MFKAFCSLIVIMLVGLNAFVIGCSKSVTEKRAARPDLGERLKRDAIKGDVTDLGTNYVSIRQSNGEVMRVRVDDNTKMDHVVVGDKVKAYATDDGYASTIQRVEP
jgi:hypothetical protein